jgi:16S rRNA (cytidine1402-2'-O)-methyltransferase
MFEEVAWGTLEELAKRFEGGTKGEIVVVIGGHRGDTISLPEALAWVEALMRGGAKRSDASAEVAKGTSFSKGELYRQSLE